MRTFWKAITFIALMNVLALVIVIGWLWQSGRLDRARINDVRQMFSTTLQDARESAQTLASQAELLRLQREQEQLRSDPSTDSAAQIEQVALVHRESAQARQRLEDERRVLAGQLTQAIAQIESNASAIEAQKAMLEDGAASDAMQKREAQFLQVVKQLEQIPPKQAKRMLETLVAENQMDQAVEYLKAMNTRSASKVVREFKTDAEIALATELLERMRTFGFAGPNEHDAAQSDDARAE